MKRDLLLFLGPIIIGGIVFTVVTNLIWMLFQSDGAFPTGVITGVISAGVAFIVIKNILKPQEK